MSPTRPILIHGDARHIPLANDSVDLVMTSPPYADARKKTYGGVHPDKYVEWFLPIGAELQRVLKPTGSFVLNIKEKVVDGERHMYVLDLIRALKNQGWLWTEEYLWHKKNTSPGYWPNRLRDCWERCLHFTRARKFYMDQQGVKVPVGSWRESRFGVNGERILPYDRDRHGAATGSGFGFRRANMNNSHVLPSNVLHLAAEARNVGHSAAYPVALPEFFIKLFTRPDDVVLDPFGGSGTTAIAAQQLGRRSILIERQWEYLMVARNRLPVQELTLFTVGAA